MGILLCDNMAGYLMGNTRKKQGEGLIKIASMTAFARCAVEETWGQAIWEIRSVNHRYREVALKIPDPFRAWENEWRALINTVLHRGKIDCYLSFFENQATSAFQLNLPLIAQLVEHAAQLASYSQINPSLPVLDLLRWPGVLSTQSHDLSLLKVPLTALLKSTLEALVQGRQQEGKALHRALEMKINEVKKVIEKIQTEREKWLQTQRQKWMQKVEEIAVTVAPERLEQEIVFYAQRSDIEEEITRLIAHTEEVARCLVQSGPVGRRLDFLMQEMIREANTLSAKSLALELTQAAIEIKVLIEQMREQIQNIE